MFSDIKKKPVKTRMDRIQLLSMFFIFKVALLTSDIVSDIWNGFDLISRGDVNWGRLTLFFSFCPFLVRLLAILVKLFISCCKKNLSTIRFQEMKFKESWRFTPILHPFEWVLRFVLKVSLGVSICFNVVSTETLDLDRF